MSVSVILVVIGIVLTVAAILLGHPCLVFAVEAFLKLAAAALPAVVGA